MNKSLYQGVIALLVFALIVLSLFLFKTNQTVQEQRLLLTTQQQKITELESQLAKATAASPENLIKMSSEFIKDNGLDLLRQIIQP